MFKVTLTTCQVLSSHVWLVVTSLAAPIQNFSAITKSSLGLCGRGSRQDQHETAFNPLPSTSTTEELKRTHSSNSGRSA